MIKKIVILAIWFFSFTSVANALTCPAALPTTDPGFCNSFVAAGTCYCANSLPKRMCMDMNLIFQRMIAMFGSIENACKFQTETSVQTCLDDWQCYLKGGKDSHGGACSGTGKACA